MRFGDDIPPGRLELVRFPVDSALLENPVNQVPGFFLDRRFFFMPGFPQMAHPMVEWILETLYPLGPRVYRRSISAQCSEGDLMDFMEALPDALELSSLPELLEGKRSVVISLAGDTALVDQWIGTLEALLKERNVPFRQGDMYKGGL